MKALQREVATTATFTDKFEFDGAAVGREDGPHVAGVDQAFLTDHGAAVSAIVVTRGEEEVARVSEISPLETPYIPGLLSFREGGPILAAVEALETTPDLWLFDGSGRIHFREAGLATHIGVILDVPTIGVAKNLLCGRPRGDVDRLEAGARVAIEADDEVMAPDGTVLGYAYQSRQYADSRRINPLYVSPGHRVCAETAVDLVAACGGDYKLPRPIRRADRAAEEAKWKVRG